MNFAKRDMGVFAYHDNPQYFLLTKDPPTVLDKTIADFNCV